MNVIARLQFELVYHNVTVQHVNFYVTWTPLDSNMITNIPVCKNLLRNNNTKNVNMNVQ